MKTKSIKANKYFQLLKGSIIEDVENKILHHIAENTPIRISNKTFRVKVLGKHHEEILKDL